MGLRYLGNIIKPGYNPLASNITTGVNVVQYQGVFTAQQQLQAQSNGQWAKDPYDYSNTLLLQADGIANGSQNNTFLDSSTNNFTITRNGNTTQGSFTPFSATGWSTYFPGSAIVRTVANPNLAFGTGAITFECWINTTSASNMGMWGTTNEAAWTANSYAFNYYNGAIILWNNTTLWSISVGNLQDGNWHHIAIVRSGTTWQVFADGVSKGTTTTEGTRDLGNNTWRVATGSTEPSGGATETFIGYISNMRVSNTAIYTSNFTPSTTPLTTTSQGVSSSNVKFLSLQSNRFVDNSTNATTFTTYGTPSVQPFSPFAPQYQWTSDVIGGSGYFDGSGDTLSLASTSAALPTGTETFSCEFWFYFASSQPSSGALQFVSNPTNGGFQIYYTTSTGAIGVGAYNIKDIATYTITAAGMQNQWMHCVVTRSGNDFRMFINGILRAYASDTYSYAALTTQYIAGAGVANSYVAGTMTGFRCVRGSIPTTYQTSSTTTGTSIFTPPTAPPTTSSQGATAADTKLLLNFTNAGILDGTMKNNLETVGNAQVSTSVVKYGSGSMYFDGSGDYLVARSSPIFALGTADFTVEFWTVLNAYPSTYGAFFSTRTGGTGMDIQIYNNAGTYQLMIGNPSGAIVSANNVVPLNTWTHIAATRQNGFFRLFINGVIVASGASSQNFTDTGCYVGTGVSGGNQTNCYMDDVRVTLGVSRYNANFIPPSVALPRQ